MTNPLLQGEHEGEAQPGLPEPLPAGERLLWQGAPDWRVLARRGFHVRLFALYFLALIGLRVVLAIADGASTGQALVGALWTLPLAALALGFIGGLAYMVAQTTVYTLTDRRLVMRVGIVLTVTYNLPLPRIDAARLRSHPGRSGDLSVLLTPENRIGYLHLWPHARPWHFARTEPMMRALPEAAVVAQLLGEALAASAQQTAAAGQVASAPVSAADAQGEPVDLQPGSRRERPAQALRAVRRNQPEAA